MTSSDYAFAAAEELIEKLHIKKESIDGLIFLSESPDYIIPSTSAVLQKRLGLPCTCITMDLNYGCSGYISGIFLASSLIESGVCKKILFLAGDTMSKYINEKDRSLRMVLGDAACATIISKNEKEVSSSYSFYVDGGGLEKIYIPAGGNRMPRKAGVTDVIEFDDHKNGRTKEDLVMDGMEIMLFGIRIVPKLIKQMMDVENLKDEDVNLYAIHQANEMMVKRIAKAIKADMGNVPIEMQYTGNCGYVSVPLMLCKKFEGINSQLKRVVACGFGAGLLAACSVWDLSETKILGIIEV